jgi:SAM-dependent methyltransferase
LLNRDAGGSRFADVLVVGAGSGNDVSRALAWGAERVDAVEIDPVIARLGARDHPDRPYSDPRVFLHVDDGRNFLRSTQRQYDLVVYALVDSLALHSGMANVRLESYLFTREALEDVRRRLKPGGLFVAYNYFRQGWIVTRLHQQLRSVFGRSPLVLTLPYRPAVAPEEDFWAFTVILAGDTHRIEAAFGNGPGYRLGGTDPADPAGPEAFRGPVLAGETRIAPAQVLEPATPMPEATDDWPFLYVRRPMLPRLTLRGVAVMAGFAALLLLPLLADIRRRHGRWPADAPMFFLGAGFMLVEARAVVAMALLFGSTWTVNAVVFSGVLVTLLAATLLVLKLRPKRLWPAYAGLVLSLGLNAAVPLQVFLGLPPALRALSAGALVLSPLLCGGVIFGVLFGRARNPDLALGANVAGTMLGGFVENASMLVGFQRLSLVALGLYLMSLFPQRGAPRG